MSFLSPLFLWFGTLVSVPIIIYLINRHRYRRRRWAAMDFLLKALRKNQRRLQIQNLLLLLVRILIILLLVVAVARPVLRKSPLGVTTGSQQNWILVLDTSYSMGYREGSRTLFDQARETLLEMVESLLQPGDTVALVTFAHDPEVLVSRSAVGVEVRERLVQEIEDVELTARSLRLVPSLRLLEELTGEFVSVAGDPEPCRILFFSDVQRKDWLGDDGPISPEAKDILGRIDRAGNEIRVVRLSSADEKLNVAVTDLSIKPELVATEVPVALSVTVTNLGQEDAENLDLTLRVGPADEVHAEGGDVGEAQLGEVLSLAAGDSRTLYLPYRFDSPGFYTVVAEVQPDALVADNRRHLVVPVRDDIRVLIVDGDPSGFEGTERETFFLEMALEPKDDDLGAFGGRFSPFQPEYVTVDQLEDTDWREYAVVILANVAEIPLGSLEGLRRYVEEGGALLVFAGENVLTEFYNEHLHAEGKGLLPVPLGDKRGDRRAPVHLQFTDPHHPVSRYFEEHEQASYIQGGVVSFFFYLQAPEPDPSSAVRVLARFNDLDRSPAVFDNPYGRGRVMWVMSTADQDWNRLAVWHDFIVFLYESISYLMGFGTRSLNLEVGDPFLRYYDPADFASEVFLHVPSAGASDLAGGRALRRAMQDPLSEGRFRISHEGTSLPGLYRLDLERPHSEQGDTVEAFAVNVDTSEGRLEGMTRMEFVEHFDVEPTLFDASERFRDMAKQKDLLRGREYWRWALWGVLILLLTETILAQLFGRRAR